MNVDRSASDHSSAATWAIITALDIEINKAFELGEVSLNVTGVTEMSDHLGILQFYDSNRILLPSTACHQYSTGLFHHTSAINHACNPNAVRGFDDHTRQLSIHACRDIQPGEEITIDYVWAPEAATVSPLPWS